jgi:DNA polymerase-3 subunit beta
VEAEMSFWCPAPAFLAAVDRVVFCISGEESRFSLQGAMVELEDDGTFNMVASDGHRLAWVKQVLSSVSLPREQGLIVEGGALLEISRFRARAADQVLCEIGRLVSRVTIGERVIYGRMAGHGGDLPTFPNYRRIIPRREDMAAVVRLRARPLVKCCETAAKLQERVKSVLVTLGDSVEILARWDGNEFREAVPVIRPAEHCVRLGLNPAYVAEAIEACQTDQVEIMAQDENSAVKIVPVASLQVLDYLQVIMPMRIEEARNTPAVLVEEEPVQETPATDHFTTMEAA